MNYIKSMLLTLNGFRKLFLCLIFLLTLSLFNLILFSAFLVDWYLATGVINVEFVKDLFIASFKYGATVIGLYMGANLATKCVYEWLAKKKR